MLLVVLDRYCETIQEERRLELPDIGRTRQLVEGRYLRPITYASTAAAFTPPVLFDKASLVNVSAPTRRASWVQQRITAADSAELHVDV